MGKKRVAILLGSIIFLGVILVIIIKVIFNPAITVSKNCKIQTTTAGLSLPALFDNFSWKKAVVADIKFGPLNTSISRSGCRVESESLKILMSSAEFKSFFDYYQNELIRQGWNEVVIEEEPDVIAKGFEKKQNYVRIGMRMLDIAEFKAFVEHN